MTYVATDEGWLYLALVLDLYARKLVGWAMSETMPQELTLCALDVALGWQDPDAGLVHHSDRGSQYAAKDYQRKLKARGITVSMSRKVRLLGHAPMESVNGTLKVECVHDEHFKTREQARQVIVEYIGYYNTERRHSSLGNMAPTEFERRWRAAIKLDDRREAPVRHRVTHRRPVRRKRPNRPSVGNAHRGFVASTKRGPVQAAASDAAATRRGGCSCGWATASAHP